MMRRLTTAAATVTGIQKKKKQRKKIPKQRIQRKKRETTEDTKDGDSTKTDTSVEWEPFAENVTLQIPVYDRGEAGVPNVTDNYWTKWVQDNFGTPYNITVEYVPITRTDVMTSYALLASSETLPTMLMEYDYPKVAQWANEGAI